VLEKLILKINRYKERYSKQFKSIFDVSSKVTHDMFDSSKKQIELEKIKLELKKKYFDLGVYVARKNIKNGHSDFTLDEEFSKLNEDIKQKIQSYKNIKNQNLD
tara:strand:+ start:804 stop:1115 length:312 start_codon:yes stop_codon:yes gene_type:complete